MLLAGLGLSSCGFKPLYGVDSASHRPATMAQFAAIEIPVMPDRLGQQMRNMLIDDLHPNGAAGEYRYRLSVVVKEIDLNIGLQENATTTRGQVRITAQYWLVDNDSGKTLQHEILRTSTGYNILINQFGSILSADDARQKGLQQVSDDITQHLALYFLNAK
jgi:LPS-assembly lipoprotein